MKEISEHLSDIYSLEHTKSNNRSLIADRKNMSLDSVYALVYMDAIYKDKL